MGKPLHIHFFDCDFLLVCKHQGLPVYHRLLIQANGFAVFAHTIGVNGGIGNARNLLNGPLHADHIRCTESDHLVFFHTQQLVVGIGVNFNGICAGDHDRTRLEIGLHFPANALNNLVVQL